MGVKVRRKFAPSTGLITLLYRKQAFEFLTDNYQ